MKKYLEYKDHASNKFWEINLKGSQVNLTYGRIGILNPAKIEKKFKGKSASEDAKKICWKKDKWKAKKRLHRSLNLFICQCYNSINKSSVLINFI